MGNFQKFWTQQHRGHKKFKCINEIYDRSWLVFSILIFTNINCFYALFDSIRDIATFVFLLIMASRKTMIEKKKKSRVFCLTSDPWLRLQQLYKAGHTNENGFFFFWCGFNLERSVLYWTHQYCLLTSPTMPLDLARRTK